MRIGSRSTSALRGPTAASDCERLTEAVYKALEAGGRMEDRRDLTFMFEDVDSAAGVARDPYGVYRGLCGYLIREVP